LVALVVLTVLLLVLVLVLLVLVLVLLLLLLLLVLLLLGEAGVQPPPHGPALAWLRPCKHPLRYLGRSSAR
jgi:hypothetical protein